MTTAHLCQVIAYDLLLINYDNIYLMLYILYVVDGCKGAYIISLICLNEQFEIVKTFQNKSQSVFQDCLKLKVLH